MKSKVLFKRLDEAFYEPDIASLNKDIKVRVSISQSLMSVELSTKLQTNNIPTNKFVEKVNSNQKLIRYSIDDNNLMISITTLVDNKPTKSTINETIALLAALLDSTKYLIEFNGGLQKA